MRSRRIAIAVGGVLVMIVLSASFLLRASTEPGELESYTGNRRGVDYAANRRDARGTEWVRFKYFNGSPEAVAIRARAIVTKEEGSDEWSRREVVQDAPVIRIPAHHAGTYEITAPKVERAWRVMFEEAGVRSTALRVKDHFQRLFGTSGAFPPFDAVRATPVMRGLEPVR